MAENEEITLTRLIHFKHEDVVNIFNELNVDILKTIFRDNRIVERKKVRPKDEDGIKLYKKQILDEFLTIYNRHRSIINQLEYVELMEICRTNKLVVDDCRGLSKDILIHIIISAVFIINEIIKHSVILAPTLTPSAIEEIKCQVNKVAKPVKPSELDEAKTKLEELRKEKMEKEALEKLLEEKILKINKKEEAEEKKRLEKEKIRLEKEAEKEKLRIEKEAEKEKLRFQKEMEEKRKITRDKKKLEENLPPPYEELPVDTTSANTVTAKGRRPMPASVRDSVWNHYIGEDINKHRCLCCKKVLISNRRFEVGHVLSVKEGGTDEINNLRPICAPCNHSMGSKNMIEFVKTYGYYIG
jgi:5-methylcytosine-specific restriction endonuclease McrA